jgi:hypothetical protein
MADLATSLAAVPAAERAILADLPEFSLDRTKRRMRVRVWSRRVVPDVRIVSTGRVSARMIDGVAVTPRLNANNHVFRVEGCKITLPVPLLSAHHETGWIGEIVYCRWDSSSLYIRAIVDQSMAANHAWQLVQSGDLRALSIATVDHDGIVVDDGETERKFFENWRLSEVSLCKAGANADAFCYPYDWELGVQAHRGKPLVLPKSRLGTLPADLQSIHHSRGV